MSLKQLTRQQFRDEYLKSLNQDISNINKNLSANRFFVETGQPSRPSDIRTITEKVADVEGVKSLLRAELKKVTDSNNAQLIIQGLGDDELKFLYTQFGAIEREIAPRFKTGVPADIFINFLRKYIERFEKTGGIEASLGEQLEEALEPVIEELATERSERTPAREKTGEYTSEYKGDIPDDENWSNFTNDDDVMNSWKEMKKEVKRQKRISKLSERQKKDRQKLVASMDTINLQGSSGVNSGKRLAIKIREWSSSNPDEFDYLTNKILKSITGEGVKMVVIEPKNRKISGKGVAVAMPTPMPKKSRQKLGFKNFGKYIIDEINLQDDIVSIRSSSKAPIPSLPRRKVSKQVSSVLKTIIGGGMPDYETVEKLNNDDKKYLSKVLKTARLSDKINIKPDLSKEDAEDQRFQILKGEIISGNDSKEVVKEFKGLLIKFSNQGRLPKRETNEILSELLMLGL
jgi:hypothetical protein